MLDRDEFEDYINKKANGKVEGMKNVELADIFRKTVFPEVLYLLNMFKMLKGVDEKTGDVMFVSIMMVMFSQYNNNTDEILDKIKRVRQMFVSIETDFNKKD